MSQTASGPVTPGTVRAPRVQVLLNGVVMQGLIGVSLSLANDFQASKFTFEADVGTEYTTNAAWWSTQTKVTAVIQAGMLVNGTVAWQTLMTGVVDDYEILLDSSTVTVNGRDLAAQLIDTKTANTYSNQTSSEIATMLAQQVGLTPVVTATQTIVGTYYQIDTTHTGLGAFSQDITEWDLLVYLAQQEGFDLFVSGTSLYFQPPATSEQAYNISWTMGANGVPNSNVIGLSLQHALTLAKGVSVTVKSYNSLTGKSIKATTSDPQYAGKVAPGGQNYVFYAPNLTPQQAIALANQRYADITRHLRTVQFDLPGDTVLTPRKLIVLSGTGTAFDTSYYPDRIDMQISMSGGFGMAVTARNVPPTPSAVVSSITAVGGPGT
jgi:phage protein D